MGGIPSLMKASSRAPGEDGFVRAWTADRGKLCGKIKFSAFSNPEEFSAFMDKGRRVSIFDRSEDLEGREPVANSIGDIPIPVCAVMPCKTQPLLAVGLCHGMVHILFVKQVRPNPIEPINSIFRETRVKFEPDWSNFPPPPPVLASFDSRPLTSLLFE